MPNDWFQRVGSSIPRGFSRYFILDLLSSQPHTGKEIIDSAEMQTQGISKYNFVSPILTSDVVNSINISQKEIENIKNTWDDNEE